MAGFTKGMRLGAGLLGLGYGVYRLSQGKKDWVTSTALTAGLTATLTGMKAKPGMGAQMRSMGNMRHFRRGAMGVAPAMMNKARTMIDALT